MNGVDWNYFNKFEPIEDIYLPTRGEGDTMATQITTAVCKLVYKWYNDGDVFDNSYQLEGWWNDLSSFANWLYKNVPESQQILKEIRDCEDDDDYEQLLKELADTLLDEGLLADYAEQPAIDSVYDSTGPFRYVYREQLNEDNNEYYYDSCEEDEDDWAEDEEDEVSDEY